MEQIINTAALFDYIQLKGIDPTFQEFLSQRNVPKPLKYSNLDEKSLSQICKKINKQVSSKGQGKEFEGSRRKREWRKGEFKLFIWLFFYYAFNESITSQGLAFSNLEFFQNIFKGRTAERMRFQLINIFRFNEPHRKDWQPSQIQLLTHIVQTQHNQQKKLQWKSIAFKLYQESHAAYFRTFGQCREMWINHLDPNVTKEKWTLQEDYKLLYLARGKNKPWSRIASKFNGSRTVHMIKNRYNSFINQGKKIFKKLDENQIRLKMVKQLSQNLKKLPIKHKEVQPVMQVKTEMHLQSDQKQLNNLASLPTLHLYALHSIENQNLLKNTNHSQMENLLNNLKLIDLNFQNIQESLKQDNLLQKLGNNYFEDSPQEMKRQYSDQYEIY